MLIRSADSGDVERIANIHVNSWRDTYKGLIANPILQKLDVSAFMARWLIVLSSGNRELFVLESELSLLGFYHIAACRDDDIDPRNTGEITAIYIDASVRRQGYGRILCEHALQELLMGRFKQALLWVFRDNVDARRFYEALGFLPDGAEKMLEKFQVKGMRYRKQL